MLDASYHAYVAFAAQFEAHKNEMSSLVQVWHTAQQGAGYLFAVCKHKHWTYGLSLAALHDTRALPQCFFAACVEKECEGAFIMVPWTSHTTHITSCITSCIISHIHNTLRQSCWDRPLQTTADQYIAYLENEEYAAAKSALEAARQVSSRSMHFDGWC